MNASGQYMYDNECSMAHTEDDNTELSHINISISSSYFISEVVLQNRCDRDELNLLERLDDVPITLVKNDGTEVECGRTKLETRRAGEVVHVKCHGTTLAKTVKIVSKLKSQSLNIAELRLCYFGGKSLLSLIVL